MVTQSTTASHPRSAQLRKQSCPREQDGASLAHISGHLKGGPLGRRPRRTGGRRGALLRVFTATTIRAKRNVPECPRRVKAPIGRKELLAGCLPRRVPMAGVRRRRLPRWAPRGTPRPSPARIAVVLDDVALTLWRSNVINCHPAPGSHLLTGSVTRLRPSLGQRRLESDWDKPLCRVDAYCVMDACPCEGCKVSLYRLRVCTALR